MVIVNYLQSVHIHILCHTNLLTLVTPSLGETNPWMTAGKIRIIDRRSMFVIVTYLFCDLWKIIRQCFCPSLRLIQSSVDVKCAPMSSDLSNKDHGNAKGAQLPG